MSRPLAVIVEDDPQLSLVFTLALSGQFAVEAISDGSDALARLAEVEPVLVVLDLHLPEVSGDRILDYIRSEVRLAKTRVILATADARQAEYLDSKADIVLLKPVSPLSLQNLAARFVP
jgi:CheY-like chemotaxis protein